MRIFGREPVAWVALVEALLVFVLVFGWWDLSREQVALITATVNAAFGVVTAYLTRDTMLGFIVGFAKAVIALAAGFGWALDDEQIAAVLAVVVLVAGFFQRTQTSPLAHPTFAETPAHGEV